ncbi:MAG: PIN domain-containing protein [Tepidisphaeraceae bacterium]
MAETATAGKSNPKTFVLDTNILLHNPNAMFMLADNEVIIPFDVLEEIDTFKTNSDDLGRSARTAIRYLDQLREQGNLHDGIPIKETGGSVKVVLGGDLSSCPMMTVNSPDNRILCTAYSLQQQGKRVVFITKDINARIKADSIGVQAEDFEATKVDFDKLYQGWREVEIKPEQFDALYTQKQLILEVEKPFLANEFALLRDNTNPDHTAVARFKADSVRSCRCGPAAGRCSGSRTAISSSKWRSTCCSTTTSNSSASSALQARGKRCWPWRQACRRS